MIKGVMQSSAMREDISPKKETERSSFWKSAEKILAFAKKLGIELRLNCLSEPIKMRGFHISDDGVYKETPSALRRYTSAMRGKRL